MSNQERAAELIWGYLECQPSCDTAGQDERQRCNDCMETAQNCAADLADAGLLAPDLPEPLTAANGNPVWRADSTLMVTRYPDGEIGMMITPEQEARYTPQAARTQAALLLAAANHGEGSRG